jgi:hypothetical protein
MADTPLGWTREEVILAIDFCVTIGGFMDGPIPGHNVAQIVQLSGLLKELGVCPEEFRCEFAAIHGSA